MPFNNPIVAGETLIRKAMKSENYQEGEAGWKIERDGDAFLNDVTMRGQIIARSTAYPDVVLKLGIDTSGKASLFWINETTGSIIVQMNLQGLDAGEQPALVTATGSFHTQLWVMEYAIGFVDDWIGGVYFHSRNHGSERAFMRAGSNDSFDGIPDVEQWEDLILQNGATDRGNTSPGILTLSNGMITLRGQVENLPGSFTLFADLPHTNYYPSKTIDLPIAMDHAGARTYTAGRLQIQADGQMVYVDQDPDGAANWISLEGVQYPHPHL